MYNTCLPKFEVMQMKSVYHMMYKENYQSISFEHKLEAIFENLKG